MSKTFSALLQLTHEDYEASPNQWEWAASEYKKYRGHLTYPSLMPNQRKKIICLCAFYLTQRAFLIELSKFFEGANQS